MANGKAKDGGWTMDAMKQVIQAGREREKERIAAETVEELEYFLAQTVEGSIERYTRGMYRDKSWGGEPGTRRDLVLKLFQKVVNAKIEDPEDRLGDPRYED